ncbi:hypothetical protein B0T21DRAFT_320230, partial [Apiosordaria backusii]
MGSMKDSGRLDDTGLSGLEVEVRPPGDRIEIRGWNSLTLVAYPLRRPEIPSREEYKKESPVTHQSLVWLQQRPQGFVLVRWFVPPRYYSDQGVMVGLFCSVDNPKEQVVIKQMYAVQIHNLGTTPTDDRENWYGDAQYTLFMKFYNGGNLHDFIESYKTGRELESGGYSGPEAVPEIFIWHYIAQVGRAYAYLHTGYTREPKENIDHFSAGASHPTKEGWVPIGHNDGHSHNIWLHYPSADEKEKDPKLKDFNACFPQVVLADFGRAHDAAHDPRDDYRKEKVKDVPEQATWWDKLYFGLNLKSLMLAFDPRVTDIGVNRECVFNILAEEDEKNGIHDGIQYTRFKDCPIMRRHYSKELLEIASKFEPMMDFASAIEDHKLESMPFMETYWKKGALKKEEWEKWPSNDWLYGQAIAIADRKLHDYRNSEAILEGKPVMWTKGIQGSMPYRAYVPQRWPFTVTQDFQLVYSALTMIRVTTFSHWPPNSVKIRLMRPRGGLFHDLVRTIFRNNKTLEQRRANINVSRRRYKYPLCDDFELAVDQTPTSDNGTIDSSSLVNVSSSSIGSQSGRKFGASEEVIQAQVAKPLRENHQLMTRHLLKLDWLRSHQIDIHARNGDKNLLAKLDEQVKKLRRERDSFWMEVERKKSDHLQKKKTKENTKFEQREQKIKSKREADVEAQLRNLNEQHLERLRKIDQQSQNLTILIKWWKDQVSLIKRQQFNEGGPKPVARDANSKPKIDDWDDADSDSSANYEKSTILSDGDPLYDEKAYARMFKFCEAVEKVKFLENPDATIGEIVNQTAFWAADNTILPEGQEGMDETFVEGTSIPVNKELIGILKNFFDGIAQKDESLDMNKTIRDIINEAKGELTRPEPESEPDTEPDVPGEGNTTAKRITPSQKKITLAEYYRKFYAGQNPWNTEEETSDDNGSDDESPPAMAKMLSVMTHQTSGKKHGGVGTLATNLAIPKTQGEMVARTLPGIYTGIEPLEKQPEAIQKATSRPRPRNVPSPAQLRKGPRPWDTVDDFLNGGMKSALFQPHRRSILAGKKALQARHLGLKGKITLKDAEKRLKEYVRHGQKKLLEKSIMLEELQD